MNQVCPICREPANVKPIERQAIAIECTRCGNFLMPKKCFMFSESMLDQDQEKIARGSYGIRRIQAHNPDPIITAKALGEFIATSRPSIVEQSENLLSELATKAGEPGVQVEVTNHFGWIGLVGAKTEAGVKAIFDYLLQLGVIEEGDSTMSALRYRVTVEGWQHYEELQKQAKDSTIAFMAMQFGDAELDKVVDEIFRDAVAQTGFRLQKLTDEQRAGLIDDQLRVQIRRARLLIADLTHANNGAYWEAGFAEGLGIPVIYTCKQSVFDNPKTKPHFDTNHYLTVPWDPENLQVAVDKLKATIRATLPEAAKMEDT